MAAELLNEVVTKIGVIELLLHKSKQEEALKELTHIIEKIAKNNQNLQNTELIYVFIMACSRRINVNHQRKNYHEILFDVNLLSQVGFDIYTNEDIFIKKMEAEMEIEKKKIFHEFEKFKLYSALIEATKEDIMIHYDTDKMFTRAPKKNVEKAKNLKLFKNDTVIMLANF